MIVFARDVVVAKKVSDSRCRSGPRPRPNTGRYNGHADGALWAERYDRDASDIFAIQDEISRAIVKALKLRLLPKEKEAIERRGTESVEAHDLYLMARQIYVTGQETDARTAQAIIRLCTRTIEIDPRYAQAWARMAIA